VKSRTSRIAAVDFCIFCGLTLGTFLSPYLYSALGFYGTFCTSGAIDLVNMVMLASWVRETRGPRATLDIRTDGDDGHAHEADVHHEEDAAHHGSFLRDLFNYRNVVNVFRTCFKKRPHHKRTIILILVFTMMLNLTTFSSK
jgi:hypothetical protein